MSDDTVRKITENTFCSTTDEDTIYCFFVDGELLYHCFSKELAHQYLEDIVGDLETKFKKTHPEYRVFIEKKNEWKYFVQRARDGVFLNGKPKQTHVVEIKRSQKLLKPAGTR
jgi:hypothetical protein